MISFPVHSLKALLMALLVLGGSNALAQAQAQDSGPEKTDPFAIQDMSYERLSSLIFTRSEQDLIEEARENFRTRPPTPQEVEQEEVIEPEAPRPRGIRELSLAGIVYNGKNDWTIWLNGQRVTPEALPKEILDLDVSGSYIQIQWFDAYTNQIYPIRLRPHQRFNLDSRIFLPG